MNRESMIRCGWVAECDISIRRLAIHEYDRQFTIHELRFTINDSRNYVGNSERQTEENDGVGLPPELADAELDELLDQASKADAAGVAPGGVGWVPTYDLNTAAAAGWLIKAGRASMLVEVDPPGSGIYTSKVFDNCRTMAKTYSTRCRMTVGTGTITA